MKNKTIKIFGFGVVVSLLFLASVLSVEAMCPAPSGQSNSLCQPTKLVRKGLIWYYNDDDDPQAERVVEWRIINGEWYIWRVVIDNDNNGFADEIYYDPYFTGVRTAKEVDTDMNGDIDSVFKLENGQWVKLDGRPDLPYVHSMPIIP